MKARRRSLAKVEALVRRVDRQTRQHMHACLCHKAAMSLQALTTDF
jgi:hypothetical protein